MKILLTGATGLLGKDILRILSDSYEIIGLSFSGKDNTVKCDIRDESKVSEIVKKFHPDLIIHSAAITDVDLCEKQPMLAHEVNTIGTRNLVWYANEIHSAFIYISTDYVFSGESNTANTEEDEPSPINVYGISKLAGERYVSYFMEEYFILRTGLLYGAVKINAVQKVIDDLKQDKELLVAYDQIISPTYTTDFAQGLKKFIEQIVKPPVRKDSSCYGTYHLVNSGACSRYELALKVAEILKLDSGKIKALKLTQLQKIAPRPRYAVLSGQKFEEFSNHKMRLWQDALKQYLLNFEG